MFVRLAPSPGSTEQRSGMYSCGDSRSLVVVASPDNPAAKPNAFIVSAKDSADDSTALEK